MTLKNKYFRINGDTELLFKILLILSSFKKFSKKNIDHLLSNKDNQILLLYIFDSPTIHISKTYYTEDILNNNSLSKMTLEDLIKYDETFVK